MTVSIDYKTLEGNFGKKFGKVGARPTDVLWDIRILLLHPNLMAQLELELRDSVHGIVGFNKNNEDILKYERWDTDYLGYDDFQYEIPQLRGAQLLIRKDYFEKICKLSKFDAKLLTVKW